MEMKRGGCVECCSGGGGSKVGQLFAWGWSLEEETSPLAADLWRFCFEGVELCSLWLGESRRPSRRGCLCRKSGCCPHQPFLISAGQQWRPGWARLRAARAVLRISHAQPLRVFGNEVCKATRLMSGELKFQTVTAWPSIWALYRWASAAVGLKKSTLVLNDTVCFMVGVSRFVQEGKHENSGPSVC